MEDRIKRTDGIYRGFWFNIKNNVENKTAEE